MACARWVEMFDLWLQVTTLRLASDQGRGHALAEPLCDPPRQRRANGTRWPDQTNEFVALARNICGALRYVALCGMWRSMVCGALWYVALYGSGCHTAVVLTVPGQIAKLIFSCTGLWVHYSLASDL